MFPWCNIAAFIFTYPLFRNTFSRTRVWLIFIFILYTLWRFFGIVTIGGTRRWPLRITNFILWWHFFVAVCEFNNINNITNKEESQFIFFYFNIYINIKKLTNWVRKRNIILSLVLYFSFSFSIIILIRLFDNIYFFFISLL